MSTEQRIYFLLRDVDKGVALEVEKELKKHLKEIERIAFGKFNEESWNDGYGEGYREGEAKGRVNAYEDGQQDGYKNGFHDGYEKARLDLSTHGELKRKVF